ncbi:MAG: hypothetical protein ACI4MC_00845, partial [Candidatus Coproplasma sp.]
MSKIVYRGKKNSVSPPDGQSLPEECVSEQAPDPSAEVNAKAEEDVNKATNATKKRTAAEPEASTDGAKPTATKSATAKKEGTVTIKRTAAEKPAVKESEKPKKEVAERTEAAAGEEIAAAEAVMPAEEDIKESPAPTPTQYADSADFDKKQIIKYFKRHPKMQINTKVDRFSPELSSGLEREQIETRFKQFLFNDTNKKYSKSYASIFIGNICTFFNLLCLLAFIALLISGIQGITNYLVIVITAANILIGIFQEIRS